ncbi:efflux RND transporter permease subunit [Marivita sp. GX14005]|uniref:efflux RND transporter permease subunit n=1 Tax=Marivita sp. GX14005 TaxID=2942276 RepID=UPI00201A041C|nr:efflux RND transporter permease subunit [Marivita sp. GX14005]MCL3881212.1 efflux RND transporter permease subunit [Marivita sp. GX14005]
MAGLIKWFLGNRVAANLLMLSLIAAGVAALLNVTVRTFPEIATGTVTVTTVYPGASPSEVADAVLTPIEQQLQGLEGVRKLTSTASRGLGTVSAELTRGANVDDVENDIETEIARIGTLPEGAEAPRIAKVEPTELAVQIALHGPVPRASLKALAERVRDELTDLAGISQVTISGVPEDQIDIEITRETLESYGIGLVELGRLVSAQSLDLTGGQIDTGRTDLQIRTEAEAEAAGQYRDIVIFTDDTGATVSLGDITRVSDDLSESAIRSTLGGDPAVYVSINRAASEQVPAITDTVLDYVETDLRPSLPSDIQATIWRNQGDILQGRIDLLVKNGLIGAALILLLLTLFLDLRIAAWVAVGVGVAFIGAFAPMLILGPTINQLSLFGFILALGIVVDDAIVVGENVFSRLEESGDGAEAAREGTLRVWRPILFSVTTTIFAFVPLLFLPGSSGSFISPVAAVVIYVLTVSLIESFLILPTHLSHISMTDPRRFSPRRLTEAARRFVDRRFRRFREGPLRRVVTGAVRHPLFTFATCLSLAIAGAGLIAGGVVKFTFFPQIEGNFVTAELRFPEGTSQDETLARADRFVAAARRAAEELGAPDIVQATAITVGFSNSAGGPGGASATATGATAKIEVKLADANERDLSAERFRQAWREAVGGVPGAREVLFSSSVIGVGAPILLEVTAEDEATRDAAVRRMREALAGRDGVLDIRDDRFSAAREIAIDPRPAAQAFGVSASDIATTVRAAFFGTLIDQFARDREEVDVRLRLVPDQRDSIADLLALKIPVAGSDAMLPITVLADLAFDRAPLTITRVDGRTITTLSADVDTAITTGGAETAWLMQTIVPQLKEDYPALDVSAGGEQEEAGRFSGALAFNFLLALFAIYAILALAFGSYGRPAIVLLVIPFGALGAVIGHAILGLDLTLLSMFGIVGLAGVIVNDSLLIVDFIQEAEAGGTPPQEAIVEATLSRFRPVMLTTLTTFLGITPLVLETSVQAQFLIPTAVSLGAGVLFVSVLQMVLVPAYAALYAGVRRRITGRRGASDPA